MNRFFNECLSVEQVKILYRQLAKQHHPDLGGSVETMKAINSQYHEALKNLNGYKSTDNDGKEHVYKYNMTVEQALIDMVDQLFTLQRATGVEMDIYIIGTWLWIKGLTKPIKDKLMTLGCRWHSKRKCWYFHTGKWSGRRSSMSLNGLANKYGGGKIVDRDQNLLTA